MKQTDAQHPFPERKLSTRKRKSKTVSFTTDNRPLSPKSHSSSTITGNQSELVLFSDSDSESIDAYRIKSMMRGNGPVVYVYGTGADTESNNDPVVAAQDGEQSKDQTDKKTDSYCAENNKELCEEKDNIMKDTNEYTKHENEVDAQTKTKIEDCSGDNNNKTGNNSTASSVDVKVEEGKPTVNSDEKMDTGPPAEPLDDKNAVTVKNEDLSAESKQNTEHLDVGDVSMSTLSDEHNSKANVGSSIQSTEENCDDTREEAKTEDIVAYDTPVKEG